jgi:hypothetical protein
VDTGRDPTGPGYTAGPAGGEVLGMLALAMHGRFGGPHEHDDLHLADVHLGVLDALAALGNGFCAQEFAAMMNAAENTPSMGSDTCQPDMSTR